MSTQITESPTQDSSGTLFYLGEPAFRTHHWSSEGLVFLQAEELDLVASATSIEDAAEKLGNMILDLVAFLVEEVDDPSDSEVETVRLITERIGPPALKFQRELHRADLLRRLRTQFRSSIDWKVGPLSTPSRYVHALSG
ncbi:MAG: hypothetical protein ACRDLF_10915 [Solirubrobacteraceae bacterium]